MWCKNIILVNLFIYSLLTEIAFVQSFVWEKLLNFWTFKFTNFYFLFLSCSRGCCANFQDMNLSRGLVLVMKWLYVNFAWIVVFVWQWGIHPWVQPFPHSSNHPSTLVICLCFDCWMTIYFLLPKCINHISHIIPFPQNLWC